MSLKRCTICKKEKPLTDYYNCKACKDGKGYRCKTCDSKARAKYYQENETSLEKRTLRGRRAKYKKYGITSEEYIKLNKEQRGCCRICGSTETRSSSHELSVDHCHTTNKIRGLLCNNCNRGLGLLGDTAGSVLKAYEYLKRFEDDTH